MCRIEQRLARRAGALCKARPDVQAAGGDTMRNDWQWQWRQYSAAGKWLMTHEPKMAARPPVTRATRCT
eukprot:scaffold20523_cov31-Tisochrysis_lutea.AAC.3